MTVYCSLRVKMLLIDWNYELSVELVQIYFEHTIEMNFKDRITQKWLWYNVSKSTQTEITPIRNMGTNLRVSWKI